MAQVTLGDLIKVQNPDGGIDKWINPLRVETQIFLRSMAKQCNNGSSHTGNRIVARATATEYSYGMGTAATKDTVEIVTDTTEGIESVAEVDIRLLERFGEEYFLREEQGRFEVLFETAADRMFNGNPATDPRQMLGLYNRSEYNALGTYVFDNSKGNGSATANKTSAWAIQQGEEKSYMIYPQNLSKIIRRDFTAKFEKTDDVGNTFPCRKTRWNLDFGFFVHDARCVARVANISCSATPNGVDEVSFDEDIFMEALMKMPEQGRGAVIYMNNTLMIQMRKRAKSMPTSYFSLQPAKDLGFPMPGKILTFDDCPIFREDKITITEGLIS